MQRHPTRRACLALGAIAFGLAGPACVLADEVWPQPGKPIRIIVPLPAGSGSDVAARLLGKLMSDELKGHPVIIENKPGASTFIGAQEVARAPADGHTLLYTIVVTHTQNPHLYAKLPYDPVKDFTPLAQVMKSATVLIAPPNAPFNNLKELVAYAKAQPGALNYASYSPGSTSHLNAELLQMRTGTKMLHVPYKGATDASRALVAGDVQIYFDGTASAVSLIKAGKAKGIGAATPTRVPVLPDLPTIQEQGVDGINIVGWQGVFGSGKMSPALTEKVSTVISKASRSREMLSLIETQGNEASGAGAAEFARIVASDSVKWGEVIKAAGIRLD
ncbi:tripartite tricarboxylate transporter substrate binding protein [Diaphorobacter ruginosibacter]|uniref:Tripartite tricarboxylate transporter substrate binding protein n=1 Tax=Diaphorobacter ruginosibacter TaxID=1715720 RepID=A0A7G9RJP9_9BURK|nr:tripartite tricarboxylate transporter substrate binding protein [Diaphorobacter ruginosibacter]QNN55824.1 tripartite tricarboxylate transporter substrate binding protein [Diaphorobacter ruginosibacter]